MGSSVVSKAKRGGAPPLDGALTDHRRQYALALGGSGCWSTFSISHQFERELSKILKLVSTFAEAAALAESARQHYTKSDFARKYGGFV